MAFENISKGEFQVIGNAVYSSDKLIHVSNFLDHDTDYNPEFIAFCFNLQQRYDISKLEEAVNILKGCNNQMKIDGYVNKTVDQLLTQIKKQPNESKRKSY